MYTEKFRNNRFLNRSLFLKLLLILAVVLLILFLLPAFRSYKSTNKKVSDEIKVREENTYKNLDTIIDKVKDASLLYFSDNKLPITKNGSKTVKLKTLIKQKLISIDTTDIDLEKSYGRVTKLDDDYLLKIYVKSNKASDYKLLRVNKYSYCETTLCEEDKNNTDKEEDDSKNTKDNKDEISTSTNTSETKEITKNTLSEFGNWSNYTKVDCNTSEIKCNSTDTNCLTEREVISKYEQVGTINKEYTTTPLILYKNGNDLSVNNLCSNLYYVYINGTLYKTEGNYLEVLNLNRNNGSSWIYAGQIKTTSIPNFEGTTYYSFVGADFSNCKDTCSEPITYIYDVYKYNYKLYTASSNILPCTAPQSKLVGNYKVVKQMKKTQRTEKVYGNVCYMRTRNRKVIN